MGCDKLWADLMGRPVVAHAIEAFERCAGIGEIVIVEPAEGGRDFAGLIEEAGWRKVSAVVRGGAERHLSVAHGLQAVSGGEERLVAIHDGARPLVRPELIGAALVLAGKTGASCVAVPVSDTLKRASAELRVTESVERANLWAMQTPQIFRLGLIRRAYSAILSSGDPITDEVSAVERMGEPVTLLPHDDWNLKITFPRDLELAGHLLNLRGDLRASGGGAAARS